MTIYYCVFYAENSYGKNKILKKMLMCFTSLSYCINFANNSYFFIV